MIASTGVSMYLTKGATSATLRSAAATAPGSTFAMSFLVPFEMLDAGVRGGMLRSAQGARRGGTPFVSFFIPDEIVSLAYAAGFRAARYVSGDDLTRRYFSGRSDGLRPPVNAESFLVGKI